MSVYVTDTHPIVWYATGSQRQLSPKVLWAFHAASGAEVLIDVPDLRRWVFVSLLGGMFVLGFVSGAVRQRSAQAQVPGVGGALGSVTELGSSIMEMQQHVDGLQKNLAILKKVQSVLGGGT